MKNFNQTVEDIITYVLDEIEKDPDFIYYMPLKHYKIYHWCLNR